MRYTIWHDDEVARPFRDIEVHEAPALKDLRGELVQVFDYQPRTVVAWVYGLALTTPRVLCGVDALMYRPDIVGD